MRVTAVKSGGGRRIPQCYSDIDLNLKLLLKRAGLLTLANWQLVTIQFAAQTTFQVLLAVPIVGAAVLVAVFLGGDLSHLLRGGMREMFASSTDALMAEPFALAASVTALMIVLVGGSVLMFLVKGGTIDVMRAANERAGLIERRPLTLTVVSEATAFSVPRFVTGCGRLFRPYLRLGLLLMVCYGVTASIYLAFVVYGFRAAGDDSVLIGWTFLAALATVGLFLWITAINLVYLLVQIAMAAGHPTVTDAVREVLRFIRAELRVLSGIFLLVFGILIAAWFASALAWSGVGLIAFVPLVGLAVFPLQIAALLVRGLVFEYIGLTAMGAYVTLYQRYSAAEAARLESVHHDAGLRPAH